ncbi:ornithine carbamoyltransferase [Desulforhopalus vacuolatus]|uniref:ornithine carbamoyltransferase n=1 Tax=Desulforhopalus vacuolatus TaxID=40414 RepID=UPI001964E1CF|nr:ornithine carbamoyltransferase [Desulforhopalus vacuolatus]
MITHLRSLAQFSLEELSILIERAIVLKHEKQQGILHNVLEGKSIALIFEKPSTRTRVSFESAVYGLGGQALFLAGRDTQLSRSEPLKDTARVMSRYVDGMVVRTHGQEVIEELADYATVPVINALTDLHHPCQILSDLMTVLEKKGQLDKLKVAWIGDGNNMANSWLEAAAILGFELVLACPEGYHPNEKILKWAMERNDKILLQHSPEVAAENADVFNADVFSSMGDEGQEEERLKAFAGYQLNQALLEKGQPDAIVMHCLPAHRGEEITEEVLEGPQSVVFDEAENKMHMHKALLEALVGGHTAS